MKQSQIELLEHSKAKVKLLGEYLDRYINIIANDGYTKKIRLYDLFCGEGLYINEGEGSPLNLLRAVKNLYFTNKAKNNSLPSIDIKFNDISKDKIEKLKQVIIDKKLFYHEFGTLSFSSNDYIDIIPNLAKEFSQMKDEKAFVFIDPYGYTEVKASHIKDLMQSKKSEVLLFLPIQFMYRFDDKGTPQALTEFISDFTDYNAWKNKNIQNVWEYIDVMKEELRKFMGKGFYVDTFSIRKDERTVFCLFFFSSHIRGFEKMLEAKWAIDEQEGRGWEYTQATMLNLFDAIKTNPFEHKLEIFLKQKIANNGEIYELCLENGFLPKHVNEIFANWQKSGKLNVINAQRKNAFYVSYPNYKDEPNKVSFKIK